MIPSSRHGGTASVCLSLVQAPGTGGCALSQRFGFMRLRIQAVSPVGLVGGCRSTLFLVCVCFAVRPLPAGRAHEDPAARFLVFRLSSPPQSRPQRKERAWGREPNEGEGGTPSYQAVRAPVHLGTHPGRAVCCLAPLWGRALFGTFPGVARGSPAALVRGEGGVKRRQGSSGPVSDPGLRPQQAAGPRASRSTALRLSVPGTTAGRR
ncbi:hypothetical protein NDU88_000410 [Pleurodeles waltl]|uniref:Uncharacterized protein n=1 Tax=Pleurodeles waltl TaxID=8319 RepID=A0AAV7S4H9_PLEWA|nr:hypothetical protein NDU88_000410 [Pleurodeles waltl]